MPTVYDIEIVRAADKATIQRFGWLGYSVVGVLPCFTAEAEDWSSIVMQRERITSEHGMDNAAYYEDIALKTNNAVNVFREHE